MNVLEKLDYHSTKNSDGIAYRFLTDGENEEVTVTYKELYQSAVKISMYLKKNFAKHSNILVSLPSGIEYIKIIYGILLAEMILIPINTSQENMFNERLASINEDITIDLIITNTQFKIESPVVSSQELLKSSMDQSLVSDKIIIPKNNTAVIQYTSGSTTNPKGVKISLENITENCLNILFILAEFKGPVVSWLPFHHDMCLMGSIFFSLYIGEACTIMSPTHFLRRPVRWLKAISKYKATTSPAPSFGYDWSFQYINDKECTDLDLSSWKYALNGAEFVNYEVIKRFSDKFNAYGFSMSSFLPCYGMAEATLLISGNNGDIKKVDGRINNHKVVLDTYNKIGMQTYVSCGSPIINCKIKVGQTFSKNDLEVGEICISGENVTSGYVSNELPLYEKMFRTGDMGFFYKKELYVLGRQSSMFTLRGQNFFPEDIKACLKKEIRQIDNLESYTFLTDNKIIHVQEVNQKASDLRLISNQIAAEFVKGYGLEVSEILFVRKNSLPKTSSGKIRGNLIKQLYGNDQLKGIEKFIVEKIHVQELKYNELLEVYTRSTYEEIDVDQSLISYGMSSMQIVEFLHQMNQQLFVDLEIEDLQKSIRELTEQIKASWNADKHLTTESSLLNTASSRYKLPNKYRSIWIESAKKKRSYYDFNLAFEVKNISMNKLKEGIETTLNHHPVLFADYHFSTDNLYIHSPIHKHRIKIERKKIAEKKVQKYLENQMKTGIDLKSYNMEFFLIENPERKYFLLRTNHLIVDLWSLQQFIYEVLENCKVNEIIYESKELYFYHYLDHLKHKKIDFEYWRNYLVCSNDFQFDFQNNVNQVLKKDIFQLSIEFSGTIQLLMKKFIDKHSVSENIVFMTLFYTYLSKYFEQENFLMLTAFHGRTSGQSIHTIGNFVEILPFKLAVDKEKKFSEICLEAEKNYIKNLTELSYGYSEVVEKIYFEENKYVNPQIMFSYRKSYVKDTWILEKEHFSSGDMEMTQIIKEDVGSIYDVDLLVETSTAGDTLISLKFNKNKLDQQMMTDIFERFFQFIEEMLTHEDRELENISLISFDEIKLLNEKIVNSEQRYEPEHIALKLLNSMDSNKQKTAVIDGNKEITYGELAASSKKIAAILKKIQEGKR